MTPLELAEEIINGGRITRQDDLTFFLDCNLDELCEGADRIRKHFVGDKVDLCSIINGRRIVSTVHSLHTITLTVRYMIFFQKRIL